MKEELQFKYIYWFIVGTVTFSAGLSCFAIYLDKTRIDIVLTFWLSTAVAGCFGYLLGSSAKQPKKANTEPATPGNIMIPEQEIETQKPKEETSNE